MILVSDKMMTPRTIDVVTLQDKDGHYVYVSRNVYDAAVVFDYQNQNNVTSMEKAILGSKSTQDVNPDLLDICMMLFATTPEPLGMLIPFLLLADKVTVPKDLEGIDAKTFGYNLIDAITNSVDIRSYVKLPDSMRAPLVGLQHIANTYKDRVAHAMGMWFTGVELVHIKEVEVIKSTSEQVASVVQTVTSSPEPTASVSSDTRVTNDPLPIPTGSITSIPAADKETAEPQANTISEEAYAALMKRMSKINETVDAEIGKISEEKENLEKESQNTEITQKQVEVNMETSDRVNIAAEFERALSKIV